MRFSINNLLIYILLFIFVISLPIDLLPISYFYQLIIRIGLRLILLVIYIFIIHQNKIKVFGSTNKFNLLLCTPFLLIAFSNIIAASIDGGFLGVQTSNEIFVLEITLVVVSAINEEIVFRLFIHNSLRNFSSIKRILLGALIFALAHLINVISVRSIDMLLVVIIQTVYSFGLGILLGFLYEYSHCLLGATFLHILFNFLNTTLYQYLGGYSSTLSFYLTAAIIGVVVGIYTFCIYKFYFSKPKTYMA